MIQLTFTDSYPILLLNQPPDLAPLFLICPVSLNYALPRCYFKTITQKFNGTKTLIARQNMMTIFSVTIRKIHGAFEI